MNLKEATNEITQKTNLKVSYTNIALALEVTRQYANQIKHKELKPEQIQKLEEYFNVNLSKKQQSKHAPNAPDCISIPVRGEIKASMGYGIEVCNEEQTGSYQISRKLAFDIGLNPKHAEMILASGDSMEPTILGGDSLIVDLSKTEIHDGKIYCVRIEGQLYAKRLQFLPPHTIVVISDNPKYKTFEVDLSNELIYDFKIIGEIRWWARIAN